MNLSKLLFAFLFLTSLNTFAFPSSEEMKYNFKVCMGESGWESKWGQYVVAFNIEDANRACRNSANGPARPALTGCHTSNGFIYAGFYCQDIGIE